MLGDRHRGLTLLLGLAFVASAAYFSAPLTAAFAADVSVAPPALAVLVGRWVRPDGGYVIAINGVDTSGRLDASYANPNRLPFYTAEAVRDGSAIKLFFELRAGGYNGSTYTLAYDPASDQLHGVYFQAVARQSFEVVFVRSK